MISCHRYPTGLSLRDGVLFGATLLGGDPKTNSGVLFKFDSASSTYVTLYKFEGLTSGQGTSSPLAVDKAGNLYGVTYGGGAYGYGMVYEFTKGADGFAPMSPLAIGKDGAIYGTSQGGAGGFGMICKIAP